VEHEAATNVRGMNFMMVPPAEKNPADEENNESDDYARTAWKEIQRKSRGMCKNHAQMHKFLQ
jgi:hypothetical protein